MVEVFKTNVNNKMTAEELTSELHSSFPNSTINFDLDDCDKVLRIESERVIPEEIARLLNHKGFLCQVLE